MQKEPTRVKAIVTAVFWYVMLLTLAPAIANDWILLSFTAAPADLTWTTWRVVYVVLSMVILLLFFALSHHRRIVFGAFAFTLLVLHSYTGKPSLDCILSFILYSAFAALLLETLRQNIPLYRELKASQKSISRILGKSLILWSPALIFIFIGLLLNHLVEDATTNALYE
ncbi:MAG TPA: hypothetical protein VGC70_07445, partial [Burkholderiales bacterium]